MSGKGGRRPGAGRKPKAVKRLLRETPIQAAESKIRDKLPWLVDKMLELAEGVEVEETDRKGNRHIYSTIPDRQAIEYLIDRVMGKAVQPVDVVETVLTLAAQQGFTEDEAQEAVTEVQRLLKENQHAGRR